MLFQHSREPAGLLLFPRNVAGNPDLWYLAMTLCKVGNTGRAHEIYLELLTAQQKARRLPESAHTNTNSRINVVTREGYRSETEEMMDPSAIEIVRELKHAEERSSIQSYKKVLEMRYQRLGSIWDWHLTAQIWGN